MRVIFCPRHPFQLTCSDKLAHENACASLNALTAIIGKFHLVLVEIDAVAKDTEHGTRTHDVGVETFLLEVSIERNEK